MSKATTTSDTVESFIDSAYSHDEVREKGGKPIGYLEKSAFDEISTDTSDRDPIFAELEAIAEEYRDNRQQYAEMLSSETGYPISDSLDRIDSIPRYLDGLRAYHDSLSTQSTPTFDYNATTSHERRVRTVSGPIGHVLMITPRNATILAPVNAASALVAGNNVTVRPSTRTPESASMLLSPFFERFPDRMNMVFTEPEIIYEPDVLSRFDLLHYEGSSSYYPEIKEAAAEAGIESNVEGEGNGVFIVDHDPVTAAQTFVCALTRCNGNLCSTPSGVLVSEDIADTFEAEVESQLRSLTVGEAANPDTDVTKDTDTHTPEAEMKFDLEDSPVELLQFHDGLEKTELFGPCAWYKTWETTEDVRSFLADREHGLSMTVFSETPAQYLGDLKAVTARVCVNIDPTIISHFSPWGAIKRSGESPVAPRLEKFAQDVIVVDETGPAEFDHSDLF